MRGGEGMNRNSIYAGIGFGLFCIGYLLINEQILVQAILYRAAASDHHSALISFTAMALQASALLIGLIFLSNRLFWLVVILIGLSAVTNLIFSQILNDVIDLAKTLLALGLFVGCRELFRLCLRRHRRLLSAQPAHNSAILLVLLPSFAFGLGVPGAIAAERNIYNFAYETLATPPPARRAVTMPAPNISKSVEKIIWIVDESVSYDAFARLIRPDLSGFAPIDFGKAAAMANCSAPAHVALRSGVDVLNVNADTDLRQTPSIWAYANKAGYKTILIDGQVSGPPQNLLLPPEASKIDEILPLASGMQTDLKIAQNLNDRLTSDGKIFIYAVLRGVHFQYSDHYPADLHPADDDLVKQYDTAIRYSKRDFFSTLMAGVDREKAAIIYTSDHGQNVEEGVLPHCSTVPEKAEFAIPLLAFLPPTVAENFPAPEESSHSASQIFPPTLAWMGYDRSMATNAYDNILRQPTKKFVWFGRAVIPLRAGDRIDVSGSHESLVD